MAPSADGGEGQMAGAAGGGLTMGEECAAPGWEQEARPHHEPSVCPLSSNRPVSVPRHLLGKG